MHTKEDYQVNSKENVYFVLKLIVSLGFYFFLFKSLVEIITSESPVVQPATILYIYIFLILSVLFLRHALIMGHLRGNGVKVTASQFPDIHQIVVNHSRRLNLKSIPDVYILQSGGILNAFASRFMGSNYIIINSDIIEAAEKDKFMLSFIIGHELGHIKRNHLLKNLLLLPSWIIPFLGTSYSRACEYTCDSIGYYLSPFGADSGLLLLAAGKTIYKKVNAAEYIAQRYTETGFWTWFAEKASTHPNLTKRLACFATEKTIAPVPDLIAEPVAVVEEKKEADYSRYMPK